MTSSTPAAPRVVHFQALHLANEQRTAYGLRYNDYTRYRKHCANRTHRLRSSLKTTHGKGRDFKKLPPLASEGVKEGHLQLFLFEAERAWAYSQDLNALSLQPANQERAATLRHTATGRFRRAVNWSTQLLSHCQSLYAASRLSAENLLQVFIYTLILNGRFLRYRDDVEDALVQLSVARYLLDQLAGTASTSRDEALATSFSDEIGPEIRYCAHQLGRSKAYDVDTIVEEVAAKHRSKIVDQCDVLVGKLKQDSVAANKGESRKKLRTLMWEGQPVDVRSPELVDVLLKVQDAETRLNNTLAGEVKTGAEEKKARSSGHSKKGVAAFDAILLALSDAEEVARKMAEARQLSGATSNIASGTRDIHFLHAYITYQLLSRRIQRDLLLISALFSSQQRPSTIQDTKTLATAPKLKSQQVDGRLYPAVVKLLDTILQSLNQTRTLSLVDESPDLAAAVEARIACTKARRCLNLARCYEAVKRYAEALTLVLHGNIYIREARSAVSRPDSDPITTGDPSYFSLSASDLVQLEGELSSYGLNLKKDWFAYNGGSTDADNKSYKKPLFFNVALNYVHLDMDRLQERAGKKPADAGRVAGVSAPQAAEPQPEKRPTVKAKVEEARPATPEPQATPVRSGLSSLPCGNVNDAECSVIGCSTSSMRDALAIIFPNFKHRSGGCWRDGVLSSRSLSSSFKVRVSLGTAQVRLPLFLGFGGFVVG